jgi:UDP-N-acetylglucosamine 2-epimerase (non-hydrolysing)
MKEVIENHLPQIKNSEILKRLHLDPGKYFVVSVHREENVDSKANFSDLLESLSAIAEKYNEPVIVSTHPRTRKRIKDLGIDNLNAHIRLLKPLGFFDYINLQINAFCVISDSGTITEESSILNFPAVTIRQVHERPEGMDEGTLIMCGLKAQRVMESIDIVTSNYSETDPPFRLVQDYDTINVSKKVLRIIMSYTDYVNRTVWHKF